MACGSCSLQPSRFSRRVIGAVAFLGVVASQAGFAVAARFSAAEGLPAAAVTAIAADQAGHLWVGTGAGLRTLAGGRFVVETAMTDARIESPVHREAIRDIAVAPTGEVWVATAGTLHRRAANGVWEEGLGGDVGLQGGVAEVSVSAAGDVWAGGENAGLARWDGTTWSVVDRRFQVTALAIDGRGVVWATGARDGEVLVADPGSQDERVLLFGSGGLPSASPQALEAAGGDVWVGTGKGLAHVAEGGTVTVYDEATGLPSASILSIAPAGEGAAWVGTTEGLARVEGGRVDLTAGIAAGLVGIQIDSLALDRAGDLWVGTAVGLVKLALRSWVSAVDPVDGFVAVVGHTSRGDRFAVDDGILYVADADSWTAVSGLEDRLVTTATADSFGGILVGTDGGWGPVRDGAFTPDARCCTDRVNAILEDAQGRFWIGTRDGALVVDGNGIVATFRKTSDAAGLGQDPVTDIFGDAAGTVWIATLNGGATPFTGLQPGARVSLNSTGGGMVSDLVNVGLVTESGDLWLGTQLGLSRRAVDGTWTTEAGVLGGPITALEDAGSGLVWAGTESSGLALVDCKIRAAGGGCAVSVFDESDGLGARHVTSLATRDGELWIGTSRGLIRHALDVAPPALTLGDVAPGSYSGSSFEELHPGGLLVDGVACDPSCAAAPLRHDAGTVEIGLIGSDVEDPEGVRFLVDAGAGAPQLVDRDSFDLPTTPNTHYALTAVAFDRHFNQSAPASLVFETAPTPLLEQPLFWVAVAVVAPFGIWRLWLWRLRRHRLGYGDALVSFREEGGLVLARRQANGTPEEWQPLGLDLGRLDQLHDQLRAAERPDPQVLATLGDKLYRAVLRVQEGSPDLIAERPVRLGLDFREAPTFEPLPWEVMQGGRELGPVAHAGRLALVRRVDTDADGGTPAARVPRQPSVRRLRGSVVRGRLRILVAWAKPRDRAFVAPAEFEAIEALAKSSAGRLEVVSMPLAQRDRVETELDQDIDVFHFIGHGEMRGEEPVLLFEDEDGWAHAADLSRMKAILAPGEANTRRPRLVVLSACQSAEAAIGQPASGLAAGLVKAGVVPAAIGMGYVFHMQAASEFSRALYASLIRHGQVEHAVAVARGSVRRASGEGQDWMVPRLHARDLGAATFEFVGGGR